MKIERCALQGLYIIEPTIFEDSRGYFFEAYNQDVFEKECIIKTVFIQDNQSSSSYGVIRGLHYQMQPFAQTKLVRVLEGTILDVAVDIRNGSPTFGQHFSIELSAENKKQIYIPHGFAHGFSVLSSAAVVLYKCDSLYNKKSEAGIKYNDEELRIDWKIENGKAIISEKDQELPSFRNCISNFNYSSLS